MCKLYDIQINQSISPLSKYNQNIGTKKVTPQHLRLLKMMRIELTSVSHIWTSLKAKTNRKVKRLPSNARVAQ